jgi:pantoate--beta-alanine ligase
MLVTSTITDYEIQRAEWVNSRVALVPTMGALHEGHGSLCRMARQMADRVVVSIFVNPLQFGPNEDLERYPRPREEDLRLCREWGVDAVFYPSVETLYPDGTTNLTVVSPPESLANRLCGAWRPGHFTGVSTVVLKLFHLLRPNLAFFGEKDAQQLAIIRRMVRDLQVPVEIVAHPVVREPDGLAMSSRNRYLQTEAQRQAALSLFRVLKEAQAAVLVADNPLPARTTLDATVARALDKRVRLQYLEAVDSRTFSPSETLQPGIKVLIAAWVDDVRLIDNLDL